MDTRDTVDLAEFDIPSTMPTILIQAKSVYGQTKYYPVCRAALTFAAMLGQTSLTPANLKHILALGYTIKYHHDHSMEIA